jgi:hypothetical protein
MTVASETVADRFTGCPLLLPSPSSVATTRNIHLCPGTAGVISSGITSMENGAGSVGVVIVGVVVVGVVVPDPPPHPAIRQTSIGIKATQKSVFIITSKPSSPY